MSSYSAASSSSQSSTSTGTRQSITKNFEAAFGKLSSSYGFGSSSRASSVPKSEKPSKAPKTSSASSSSFSPSLSRTSSSVALLEKDMDRASITEPSSRVFVVDLTRQDASKAPASRVSAPKDYEAAFGALSSSYGFSGAVPSLQNTRSTKAPKAPKAPKASKKTETASRSASSAPKNFEAAYGALVSQNGWGSSVAPSTASQGVRFTIA